MPCLILCGHPCSGKTTLANKLRQRALLHASIDSVVIINEESEGCCSCPGSGFDVGGEGGFSGGGGDKDNGSVEKNTFLKEACYTNQLAEKQTRGTLKAAFDRVVGSSGAGDDSGEVVDDQRQQQQQKRNGRRTLIILDSMNYIKGFRYELHCLSKAAQDQHAVLWILNRRLVVQQWNLQACHYSPQLLEQLMLRFEPPDVRNRWDRPLFTIDLAPPPMVSDGNHNYATATAIVSAAAAASEALHHSVYNMHALSDVLLKNEEPQGGAMGTVCAAEDQELRADNDVEQKQQQQQSTPILSPKQVVKKKSAFSRAVPNKKSALSKQRKQPVKAETLLIDGIPSELMGTNDNGSTVATKPKQATVAATNNHNNNQVPPISSSTTITTTTPKSPPQTLDEQLDAILDAFLLQTQALKEGMSTRNAV